MLPLRSMYVLLFESCIVPRSTLKLRESVRQNLWAEGLYHVVLNGRMGKVILVPEAPHSEIKSRGPWS